MAALVTLRCPAAKIEIWDGWFRNFFIHRTEPKNSPVQRIIYVTSSPFLRSEIKNHTIVKSLPCKARPSVFVLSVVKGGARGGKQETNINLEVILRHKPYGRCRWI